jgi:3-phenylpropionate/trans-cinnamate dioxygenase ferredoxin reductase subunit
MPGTREYDYVIVGGGLAAAAAVDGIRELDAQGSILLITEEAEPPYQRPPLSKEYLQIPDLPRSALHVKPEGWFDRQDRVHLETRQRVLVLDPSELTVLTARGNVYHGRRILLATGGRARHLEAPGMDLDGVFSLRTVEDSEALRQAATEGERAILVGAGFVGMELASSLSKHDVTSLVIETRSAVWPRVLPLEISRWMREMFEARGVEFLLEAEIECLEGTDRVRHAIAGGQRRACDFVVVGVGMSPNEELAADAGLSVSDGIRVDARGETSHPHIYAAGDVARFPDPVFGGTSRLEHWEHAREHGRLVGRSMAGASDGYDVLSYFFSRVFDVSLDIVGRPGAGTRLVYVGEPGQGPCIVLCGSDDRLDGIVLLDASSEIEPARSVVRRRPTMSDLVELLPGEGISLNSLAGELENRGPRERQ